MIVLPVPEEFYESNKQSACSLHSDSSTKSLCNVSKENLLFSQSNVRRNKVELSLPAWDSQSVFLHHKCLFYPFLS